MNKYHFSNYKNINYDDEFAYEECEQEEPEIEEEQKEEEEEEEREERDNYYYNNNINSYKVYNNNYNNYDDEYDYYDDYVMIMAIMMKNTMIMITMKEFIIIINGIVLKTNIDSTIKVVLQK